MKAWRLEDGSGPLPTTSLLTKNFSCEGPRVIQFQAYCLCQESSNAFPRKPHPQSALLSSPSPLHTSTWAWESIEQSICYHGVGYATISYICVKVSDTESTRKYQIRHKQAWFLVFIFGSILFFPYQNALANHREHSNWAREQSHWHPLVAALGFAAAIAESVTRAWDSLLGNYGLKCSPQQVLKFTWSLMCCKCLGSHAWPILHSDTHPCRSCRAKPPPAQSALLPLRRQCCGNLLVLFHPNWMNKELTTPRE